jgi:hypothetical protein
MLLLKLREMGWVWWFVPAVPALGRKEDKKFEARVGYIARLCLNKQTKNKLWRWRWECLCSMKYPFFLAVIGVQWLISDFSGLKDFF